MSGISDNFAYINIDAALPKMYVELDKDIRIFTAPNDNKINHNEQQIKLNNVEMERANDDEFYRNQNEIYYDKILENAKTKGQI